MYEIFERLMQEKGVSMYRVAKDTGIAQATLIDWKNGRYTPKLDKMQKIADYFCVPLEYLLSGEEEGQKNSAASDNTDDTKAIMEFEEVISQLPKDKQKELLRYARFLASQPQGD